MSQGTRDRIRAYRDRLGQVSLRVHAQPCTWSYIKATARAQKHRRGLDVLIVDYLQLIRADEPGRSREQEVAQVSRELKQLARELECAVVVPAQLNRGPASRADNRPMKSDLRDSGQIEQDADAVILLWPRTDEHGSVVNVVYILDKNRHGPRGELEMIWNAGYGRIDDPALHGGRY
jgi:replicative DNA helicase